MRRWARNAITVAAVAVLVAACASNGNDGDDGAGVEPSGAPSSTTSVGSAGGEESGPAEAETVVEVVVADGEVAGGVRRVEVGVGDHVVLRVTSDVGDEIHLHGYDLRADVAAGGTADLAFTAEIPGVFEAELEQLHLELVELEVRP